MAKKRCCSFISLPISPRVFHLGRAGEGGHLSHLSSPLLDTWAQEKAELLRCLPLLPAEH